MGVYIASHAGEDWFDARKTLTFNNSSGALSLFTVTGDVEIKLTAVCKTDVASGAAGNVSVGISGSTSSIIATTVGTDIDQYEIWHDATPDATIEAASDAVKNMVITNGSDIILTCSAQIDSGVIEFNCQWRPISAGATVTAA